MQSLTGKAVGGVARAKALTAEERKSISLMGVEARKHLSSLPKASHRGELKIGDMVLACCVLEDGRRLISENAINSVLGSSGGKTYRLRAAASAGTGSGPMPLFLASKPLQPFIHAVFGGADLAPIEYNDRGKIARGFEATILPKVCEVWIQASEAGMLQQSQASRAHKASILIRGLAHVGVVALVDEATGYQKDRARDALAKILEAYVAKELQPWVKTFDADYYEQMFRLRGLPYPPEKINYRPSYFGHLTNDIVYSRLAPGVLAALKEEAKKNEKKGVKLFQHLTAGYGRQELLKHLGLVVGMMKISKDWAEFMRNLNKVAARYDQSMTLDLDEADR